MSCTDHSQGKYCCYLYISLRYILNHFMDNQNFQDGVYITVENENGETMKGKSQVESEEED